MITAILENCTKDTKYNVLPHNRRHRLITPIIVVSSIDDYKEYHDSYYDSYYEKEVKRCGGLLFKKIDELDFWNDISGFFHANTSCYPAHPVYDTTNGDVEIPHDIEVRRSWDGELGSTSSPIVAGTIIVDKDYNVYQVYGWVNQNGSSDIYFDFV